MGISGRAPDFPRPILWGAVLVAALVVGLVLGLAISGGSGSETTQPNPGFVADVECDLPPGQPFVGGPSVELVDLGEVDGVRVEGAAYPRPDYPGDPWSQWGQGLVLADGRVLSAIGDQLGRDGNSYFYEYDPTTGVLAMLGDVLSYVEHEPGSWGYGKVHGRIVAGPCGEVYASTYWGRSRDLEFSGSYRGDVLLRLDPYARTISVVDVLVEEHGVPSLTGDPSRGLLYGEAIDPLLKQQDIDQGPFFVYDAVREEKIFESPPTPHVGFRNILIDAQGRAYYSIGGGELAVYDPETNQVQTHPYRMPGDWLRASTTPTPDGRVIGVTRDPDTFFVLTPSGKIELLGAPPYYTSVVVLAPGGESFYYIPDAHGSNRTEVSLTRVDTTTGEQTVVVDLAPLVEAGLGLRPGGTFNLSISPEGDRLYVGLNSGALEAEDPFGEVVFLVVYLP